MEPIDENRQGGVTEGQDDDDDVSSEEMLPKPEESQDLEGVEAIAGSSEDVEEAGEDVTADKEGDEGQWGGSARSSQDIFKAEDPAGNDAAIGDNLREILMGAGPPSERHTSVTNNAEDDIAPLNDLGDIIENPATAEETDPSIDKPVSVSGISPAETVDTAEEDFGDKSPQPSEPLVPESVQPDPVSESAPAVPTVEKEDVGVEEVRGSEPMVVRDSSLPSPPPPPPPSSSVSYFGSPITGPHPVHETIDEEVPSDLMDAVNEMAPEDSLTEVSTRDSPAEVALEDTPIEEPESIQPAAGTEISPSPPIAPETTPAVVATPVTMPESSGAVSTPAVDTETQQVTPSGPQGLPSLPARAPRPAGLGAGGLPPRPSPARPTGMGGGLPPNPNVGARPQRNPANPLGSLLMNPMAQFGSPVRAAPVEDTPEVREARQKLMDVRLKMLRIAARLELPHMDIAVQEFMNKIDMTERVRYPPRDGPFRPQLDVLFNQAIQMNQADGPDSDLGVSVTVLVLGPVDSGKTSLIRNLLHPGSGLTDDFAPGPTDRISTYAGDVLGVHFTFIDTPGLSMSSTSMYHNMNILKRTREVVNRKKPDVVIYVDRLDVFRRELTDVPLLRLVNQMLPEMLYSAVVMLTRGCAPPPDNADANGMEYPDYYRHRLDVAGQVVSHAISDMRWGGRPMGFENHPNCSLENGVAVLPIGHPFKKQALYHLISSKMFGDIEKICNTRQMKRRTVFDMMRMVQPRRQLQLTALVSQLLTSRSPKKYQEEERELKSRAELDEMDALTRQIEENKVRDYIRSRRVEQFQEEQHPTQVPVVATTLELNPSFDHDVNQHRYRGSDFVGGWSVRPIVSSPDGTFDHDDGIEMFQLARESVLRPKKQFIGGFPATMIVQVGKAKNALNLTMDTGISAYCGRKFVITANSVIHPAGQDGEFVYTPMVDFRLKTSEWNKVSLGLMACRLAESGWPHKGQLSYGAKIEEKVKIKEGVKVVTAVGLMTMKGVSNQPRDLAYGASADLKLSGGKGEFDPNFIIGIGMNHHKRGSINRRGYSGQISAEKALSSETIVSSRVSMNTGGTGQMTARMVTHDKPAWGWSIAVPLGVKLFKRLSGQGSDFA